MKKLILLLMLIPTFSFAEWEEIKHHEFAIYYVEPRSITIFNRYVTYKLLTDLRRPMNNMLSAIQINEIDCESTPRKERILSFTQFTGPMGAGESQTLNKTQEWKVSKPDTTKEAIMDLICKVKDRVHKNK